MPPAMTENVVFEVISGGLNGDGWLKPDSYGDSGVEMVATDWGTVVQRRASKEQAAAVGHAEDRGIPADDEAESGRESSADFKYTIER